MFMRCYRINDLSIILQEIVSYEYLFTKYNSMCLNFRMYRVRKNRDQILSLQNFYITFGK